MPLNRACIGKQYPSATTEVTLEATKEYARAYNDGNPRFFDPNSPGGIVAPPMFAVVVTWIPVITVMTDPELHADLLRLLHSAQDMEFLAPIRPGDTITTSAAIASIESTANGESMTLALAAQNQHGETVNRSSFSVFIRGRRDSASAAHAHGDATPTPARSQPLMSVAQTIDRDQTLRYAEASGDLNPIHVDDNVARMAGLPGIVVHGLCTMAFTSSVMIDQLCAGDPSRLKRLAVRFSRPVFPGDTITTNVWPDGERGGRRLFAYETCNAEGLPVIRDGIVEVTG
jgi:acyl dehydratase